MWRHLSEDDRKEFKQWAVEQFCLDPNTPINPTWHPVIRIKLLSLQLQAVEQELDALEASFQ
jgi:hypothetical protein